MKILLVTMPWHSLSYPSLAIGILKRKAEIELPDVEVDVSYASLEFAEYVAALSPRPNWPIMYNALGDTVFSGIGDWIFSEALNGARMADVGAMRDAIAANSLDVEFIDWLRSIASDFISQ